MSTIKINVISDSICPFCYLGYKKVLKGEELAQKAIPELSFDMKFSPFLLDPTLPTDHGVNKMERYAAKFGGMEKVNAMVCPQGTEVVADIDQIERMKENGKPYGINFSYGGNLRQTTDSHRLLTKAYNDGGEILQRKLLEGLFAGYFEHEQDPGEPEFLATESEKAGLGTKEEILDFLASDDLKAEVQTEISHAQAMGVSGVPFFVINDKYAISGAQDPETFAEVFQKIAKGESVH